MGGGGNGVHERRHAVAGCVQVVVLLDKPAKTVGSGQLHMEGGGTAGFFNREIPEIRESILAAKRRRKHKNRIKQIWQRNDWHGNESKVAVSLRDGDVKAGVVVGGVGVGVLEEAVGVGGALAEVLPGLEVGAGLDVKVFPGRTLRL